MTKIDQNTALYGVVGFPVGHSLSPLMQNTAFEETGLNAVYLAFETQDIQDCIRGMRALGIRGLSVTIPHKSAVMTCLDEVDPLAARIGAVNTVVNENGRLTGYNTDGLGALKALEDNTDIEDKICFIIGAGGAARAIGCMLKEKGARLSVVNRSQQRGKELALLLQCPYIPLNELSGQRPHLLIQTTPVGMVPHQERCPVPESFIREDMIVMDVIYNPLETRLLKTAREKGCSAISGLTMFVHQGAEQFRLWTGLQPPISTMRRVVECALSKEDESH